MNLDELKPIAELTAKADSAFVPAVHGGGRDSHGNPLPDLDRNILAALEAAQHAGALASDCLLRLRGGVGVLVVACLLLGATDAEGSSRPRREEREAAVSTLDAQESASPSNVVRGRALLVGGGESGEFMGTHAERG